MQNTIVMSTDVAKPTRVAIIGASGSYGRGILARAEEIGVEVVLVVGNSTPPRKRTHPLS